MDIEIGRLTALEEALGPQRVDLFIGSASFEARCRSVLENLQLERVMHSVVAVNHTFEGMLRRNRDWFNDQLGDRVRYLDVYSHDPVRSLFNIEQVIFEVLRSQPEYVMVDITSFTRESLIMLVRILSKLRGSRTTLMFIYANAREYSVDRPDDTKWLSDGIRDIRPVLGYPGYMRPSCDTHMIVMVGFEDERALELIRACEPTHVSLGLCDPRQPGTEPHQDTNIERLSRLQSVLPDVRIFTFSGYDAVNTERDLQDQIGVFPGCNVVIAPMNTKISTVGAALAGLHDESIQLCYAAPYFYNFDHYSLPGEDYYLFSLPTIRNFGVDSSK